MFVPNTFPMAELKTELKELQERLKDAKK